MRVRATGPAGRLVRIGGRAVHVLGTEPPDGVPGGTPTVVFESGLAAPVQAWTWVREAVTPHARTVSYERAGTGFSGRAPGPRAVPRLAAELGEVLDALAVTGPVVLVGHSFGGLVTRCFAGRYPHRVAGLVLVDALHPEELRRSATQRRGMAWLEQSLQLSALRALLRLGRREIADQFTELPETAARQARERMHVPGVWRTAAAELVAWKNADPADLTGGPFPAHSTLGVVISGESLRNDAAHRKLQDELCALAPDPVVTLVRDASHFGLVLEREHGRTVADTINTVLATANVPDGEGEHVAR
ncbi:alpha/beta fold hydrolase [Saccharomonospora halophila]|uniref:alpha/beta fold hydrolase n=1 Tax=Saccharomonospora halophila TaxID=129922 RepID=UPI0012FB26D6|nr:alpha/beta hydrolase [Saccharomonospora halophila]